MVSLVTAGILLVAVSLVLSKQVKHSKRFNPLFEEARIVSTVSSSSDVREASGICASRIHPGILYTHNDSGDHTHSIYAINVTSGQQVAKITIKHAISHNWEDIACGLCKLGHYCIYVADTGGHSPSNTIYRIKEPDQLHSHVTVDLDSKLTFSWDEHDCQTLMVDPSAELYVVSKVHKGHGRMVKLPSTAWGSSHRVSVDDGIRLDGIHSRKNDPVGGDISGTGYEVLIKTIEAVNYYYVPDHDYLKHMSSTPQQLPYHRERLGEAIAWDPNVRGYYTLGEGTHQPIYFYERQPTSSSIVG